MQPISGQPEYLRKSFTQLVEGKSELAIIRREHSQLSPKDRAAAAAWSYDASMADTRKPCQSSSKPPPWLHRTTNLPEITWLTCVAFWHVLAGLPLARQNPRRDDVTTKMSSSRSQPSNRQIIGGSIQGYMVRAQTQHGAFANGGASMRQQCEGSCVLGPDCRGLLDLHRV